MIEVVEVRGDDSGSDLEALIRERQAAGFVMKQIVPNSFHHYEIDKPINAMVDAYTKGKRTKDVLVASYLCVFEKE